MGYIVYSYFEDDYAPWIGVHARPKDKPAYLDPRDAEGAALQENIAWTYLSMILENGLNGK